MIKHLQFCIFKAIVVNFFVGFSFLAKIVAELLYNKMNIKDVLMRIKLLNKTRCPERKREDDAGYDFYLNAGITLKAHEVTIIDTGVCVELPTGFAGLLAMRSSICKKSLIIQQPLIDSNYRGELHGMIYNAGDEDISFKAGDRLYSMYVFPVFQADLEVVEDLSETDRGAS